VASFKDKDGNDIEMGLHVFFGCYFNLFRLMAKCGVLANLLVKEHTHTFVNAGGDVRGLDFRFFVGDTKIGAPFHGASRAALYAVLLCAAQRAWSATAVVSVLVAEPYGRLWRRRAASGRSAAGPGPGPHRQQLATPQPPPPPPPPTRH
jgi:hypothetical protein